MPAGRTIHRLARGLAERVGRPLCAAPRRMMRQAIEDGRIVIVPGVDPATVPEAEARRVQEQEVCRDCGAPVVVASVGGRTAYVCPVEQPE